MMHGQKNIKFLQGVPTAVVNNC